MVSYPSILNNKLYAFRGSILVSAWIPGALHLPRTSYKRPTVHLLPLFWKCGRQADIIGVSKNIFEEEALLFVDFLEAAGIRAVHETSEGREKSRAISR